MNRDTLYMCKTLIESFIEKNNYSIESFASEWMRCEFFNIFYGKTSANEIRITVAEVFQFAKYVMTEDLPDFDGSENLCRVGSLYLLFTIYYKEPLKCIKIGISPTKWEKMCTFFYTLKSSRNLDIGRYMFCKLIEDQAFIYNVDDMPIEITNSKLDYNGNVLRIVRDFSEKIYMRIETALKYYLLLFQSDDVKFECGYEILKSSDDCSSVITEPSWEEDDELREVVILPRGQPGDELIEMLRNEMGTGDASTKKKEDSENDDDFVDSPMLEVD